MPNCPFPTPARLYTPPAHALHKMPPLREPKTERGSAKRYEVMDPRASPVPFNMNPSSSPEEPQTTPTPVAKGRKIARLEADTFRWSLQVGTAAESLGSAEEDALADDVGNGLDEYELDSECGPGSLADLPYHAAPAETNDERAGQRADRVVETETVRSRKRPRVDSPEAEDGASSRPAMRRLLLDTTGERAGPLQTHRERQDDQMVLDVRVQADEQVAPQDVKTSPPRVVRRVLSVHDLVTANDTEERVGRAEKRDRATVTIPAEYLKYIINTSTDEATKKLLTAALWSMRSEEPGTVDSALQGPATEGGGQTGQCERQAQPLAMVAKQAARSATTKTRDPRRKDKAPMAQKPRHDSDNAPAQRDFGNLHAGARLPPPPLTVPMVANGARGGHRSALGLSAPTYTNGQRDLQQPAFIPSLGTAPSHSREGAASATNDLQARGWRSTATGMQALGTMESGGILAARGGLAVLPAPPGGYPEQHRRGPYDMCRHIPEGTLSAFATDAEAGRACAVEILGNRELTQARAKSLCRTLWERLALATGEGNFRVDALPALATPDPPTTWTVRGLTPQAVDLLVDQKVWRLPDITFVVHRGMEVIPRYLFTLGPINWRLKEREVLEDVRATFMRSGVVDYLTDLLAERTSTGTVPMNDLQAVALTIIATLEVRIFSYRVALGNRAPADVLGAAVYCDAPTLNPKRWTQWQAYLRALAYTVRVLGEDGQPTGNRIATGPLPFTRCSYCYGADHMAKSCTYPGSPRWSKDLTGGAEADVTTHASAPMMKQPHWPGVDLPPVAGRSLPPHMEIQRPVRRGRGNGKLSATAPGFDGFVHCDPEHSNYGQRSDQRAG
ncbi:hypothetical protein C8Q73DRAFT_664522 [Cubamyces lactineus]|nr:hypothetical protein C8Q73DRAFT_666507 [Cubamyces lactineus]KAH9896827.1 hypothetical protein C8Q73DRAFT_664522 [Cubamyces lactineus]